MKRRFLGTTALVAVGALTGCAWLEQVTGTTTPAAAVQAIFNSVQYELPLVDALAVGIAMAVPGLASAMTLVEQGIAAAGPIFQTFQTTMTAVQAQPIVAQIEGYVSAGMSSIVSAVNATPSLASNQPLQTRLAQAQAVLGLLTTFINGVTAGAKATIPVPLPLLHS